MCPLAAYMRHCAASVGVVCWMCLSLYNRRLACVGAGRSHSGTCGQRQSQTEAKHKTKKGSGEPTETGKKHKHNSKEGRTKNDEHSHKA
mmetsp:Transcript_63781/g.134352  ORF Transcript_63781/g.134352 Transcript_63781/m.134352 type:complete len:89 (+) Transcript_63781:60-326(+)